MKDDIFSPMIDSGSSRVYNCNAITLKLLAETPEATPLFFRHAALNEVVVMKHSVLPIERRTPEDPAVGTKLYFPFNARQPHEGGSTIFLHDRQLERALNERCGVNRRGDTEAFDQDLRLLRVLAKLPTLDPFLLRDALETEGIVVHERYLDIADEQWGEIQGLIQQKFVPIVKAAYPDTQTSSAKAKKLIELLWEAKDAEALSPIIRTFGLPEDGALEILYAWKVITFYCYQYRRLKPVLLELARWLKEGDANAAAMTGPARTVLPPIYNKVRAELRVQWAKIEGIVGSYEDGYDKMFIRKTDPGPFLSFLRNARATFWDIGDALGKIDHVVVCWDRVTRRYPLRHVHPVEAIEATLGMLDEIMGADLSRETVAVR